jgi:hypothetical protein
LEDIDNRPDVASEYQHAPEAVVAEVHHAWFLPSCGAVVKG